MTRDEFFGEAGSARSLFEAVSVEIAQFGKVGIRVTKSQIAYRRKRNVAVIWMPGKYLKVPAAPLVLTMSFAKQDDSPKWKQITQVSPKRFTHHLELRRVEDIDSDVKGWLHAAWEAAT